MVLKITSEEIKIINNPIQSAKGLGSCFYTSDDGMHLDATTTLEKSWTCLGNFGNLETGSYQTVDLLKMPFVVVRGSDNVNRVFHNICRHRGHRLLEASGVLGDVIKCPYHSWIYELNGALRETPHIEGYGTHTTHSIDLSEYGLVKVRSDTWMGLTFVNLSGNAITLKSHLTPLINRWSELVGPNGLDELSRREHSDSTTLTVNANWKLIVENYLESYHLPWVHPVLNKHSKSKDHYNIVINNKMAGQGSRKYTKQTEIKKALEKFPLWPSDKERWAEYIAVFPNLLLGIHIDHVFSVVLHPLAADKTLETLQMIYLKEKNGSPRNLESRASVLSQWDSVFKEDISPLEGMQKGRESRAFDGGVFSPKLEVATHVFHKWAASMYAVATKAVY